MSKAKDIIEFALKEGRKVLSEWEAKQVLADYGIPVTREFLVKDEKELSSAAEGIGYPLVLKGCSPEVAHKTEQQLVWVDVRNEGEAVDAFQNIMNKMNGTASGVLVQELIKGRRELVAGLTRDAQFGPCVMFGLGGIFTEILDDVSFRLAPLNQGDALEMMREIRGRKILDSVRGMEAADREALAQLLINLGRIGLEEPSVNEIDINPLILSGAKPVAVDALISLAD